MLSRMADYTLKNIPEDLFQRLRSAAEEEFRSLNQEVLSRLSRSFDAQDARMSAIHARWVHESLASGDSTPLKARDLDAAFDRGIARAKSRKAAVSSCAP